VRGVAELGFKGAKGEFYVVNLSGPPMRDEAMSKKHLNPPSLFPSAAHGFSQIVIASGSRTVFVSGQTAWDADKRIVGRSCAEQARQALNNVKAAVEAAGGTVSDIVALRIYVVHIEDNVEAVGEALRDVFIKDPPTSTWIGVSALAVPEFLVEVEATAVLE
jgi:2-iminobutanoate/2-iminopropanoate deaminase